MSNKSNTGAKHVFSVCFRMMRIAMPKWSLCIAGGLFAGLGNYALNLAVGLMMTITVNRIQANISPTGELLLILLLVAVFVGITLIGYILNARGAMSIRVKFQRMLLKAWVRQSESWTSRHHSGDTMAIASTDMEAVENFFFQGIVFTFLMPFITGLAASITLAAVSWYLLAAALVIGSLSLVITMIFSKKMQEISQRVRAASSTMTSAFEETVSGNLTHRMLGTAQKAVEHYNSESQIYKESAIAEKLMKMRLEQFTVLLKSFSDIVFITLSLYLASIGKMEFSSVLLAMTMQGSVVDMLGSFSNSWNFMVSTSTSCERVFGAMNWPSEDLQEDKPKLPESVDGRVLGFRHIDFGYTSEMKVLKDISFDLLKGKSLALVGGSGAGKSTVLQLLLQFYLPGQGDMKMDEVSYRDCSVNSWRGQMAYIPQDAALLNKTVRENIAMGVYGEGRIPTEEEIIQAAARAGAHNFIMQMENGYDTVIAENGGNISGGQKQRIAIARAFLSDAPIMLLDEPTATLDAESEQQVLESIEELNKGRTLITVAHKLNTIRDYDCILVMKDGSIAESGKHDELLAKNGVYTALYNQFITETAKA